jgi:signal transduction histidine kinase
VKTARPPRPAPPGDHAGLRARLAIAEETLRAIRSGEVDSMLGAGKAGSQVFTLNGAEHPYRMLIESMNEGALMLTADQTILYANLCFARMVKFPLEQIISSSFRGFLAAADLAALRLSLKPAAAVGAKIQIHLLSGDGSPMPASLSIRPLARNGFPGTTFGIIVTDMTETRAGEELLRTFSRRVVQAQETERGHVAVKLHDTVTQMLCAVLVRSQMLVDQLPARHRPARGEAKKLHAIIRRTIKEVECISRNLHPSVLNHIGLVASLHGISTEFARRTGVSIKLVCAKLTLRLPAGIKLALYRILQETLRNIEKHAGARHVTVHLTKPGHHIQLTIHDDGIGFDPDHHPARPEGKGGFGLLGMRERATDVGGHFKVSSILHAGTEIEVRIPLPSAITTPTRPARKPVEKRP